MSNIQEYLLAAENGKEEEDSIAQATATGTKPTGTSKHLAESSMTCRITDSTSHPHRRRTISGRVHQRWRRENPIKSDMLPDRRPLKPST
jgi:hypothetical protein